MIALGTFDGWRLWVAAILALGVVAALLLPFGVGPQLAHMLAFGAAVLNIVAAERSSGTLSGLDLGLLFASGFIASAYGAPSFLTEVVFATLRMTLLGGAVTSFAWAYSRWRSAPSLDLSDILLIAILGAFLPLAVAIYAVAFAVTLTIAAIAALHLVHDEKAGLSDQVPIASTLSVLYFCVWVAYRFKSDITF